MNELKELYATKGELLTRIELMQNELQRINQSIIAELKKPQVEIPIKNNDTLKGKDMLAKKD